jgi:two-component system, response regulator PdtaR
MSDASVPKSPVTSLRAQAAKAPNEVKPVVSKNAPESRGKVLVVDDDPVVLESIDDCLTAGGFEVIVRSEALGTSQWIAQNEVDIVLLDLMMPAMGGADLATFLKRRGLTRKLSVILHSSKNASELAPLVRQTGALGAIPKTGDTLSFLSEFERLAERHFRTKEGAEGAKKPSKP